MMYFMVYYLIMGESIYLWMWLSIFIFLKNPFYQRYHVDMTSSIIFKFLFFLLDSHQLFILMFDETNRQKYLKIELDIQSYIYSGLISIYNSRNKWMAKKRSNELKNNLHKKFNGKLYNRKVSEISNCSWKFELFYI